MGSFIFVCLARVSLFATIIASMSSTALAAPALPRLDDSQLQGFLDTLKTEYEQYLSSGSPHLVRPSEAKAWPCKLTMEQLNKIAGTVNSDDDPAMKRRLINSARSDRREPISMVYANQSFYPVQATCVAGKLEGPVDFWVEYDSTIIAPPTSSVVSHLLSHIRFTAINGNPIGLVLRVNQLLKSDTTYNNPATAEMMSKKPKQNPLSVAFSAVWVSEPPVWPEPSVNLSHVDTYRDGKAKLFVSTTRPFGGNRHEDTMYGFFGDSTHKDSTTLYKDGKNHGPQIRYPGMMGTFPVPGEQTCWEDGEKIMANPCTVD